MSSLTVYQKVEEAAGKYPHNVALGYKIGGHYRIIKYKELINKVNRCVSGLKKIGVAEGDKVAILSKNRTEWAILDLALNKMGAISVPIHTSLSPKLIAYIINNSGAKFLAIGDFLSKYYEIKSQISLSQVITFPKIEWQEHFIHFEDLLKADPDSSKALVTDFCTIIYTSGTTGDPKGVMLSNQNFITNIIASTEYIPVGPRDVFLSFLPLSHVLERTAGHYGPLFFGAAVYYAGNYNTVADDIKKVRPTIMVSIPRLFEKFYDKFSERLRRESAFKQSAVYGSLKVSRVYLNRKKAKRPFHLFINSGYYLANKLVLSKIRGYLGGRLKFAISGGAPLPQAIARFFENCGIKVLEGYGLTETAPIISVNPVDHYKFNTVGKVISGVSVKISEDKEVLVKGPNVMLGYFGDQVAIAESFTADGWFKTGDLGYLDEEGFLAIIGRKKEMLVLSNGKNVNPITLENALQQSKYIHQAMVVGDKQKFLSALIVPDFDQIKAFAEEKELSMEIFELLRYEAVINLIKEEINVQLKEFSDNEQIRKFTLLDKEFSEEREELTPTLKLRREKILENYGRLV